MAIMRLARRELALASHRGRELALASHTGRELTLASRTCRELALAWFLPLVLVAAATADEPPSLLDPLVSLHVVDARLSEVAKQLNDQTGLTFDLPAVRYLQQQAAGGAGGGPQAVRIPGGQGLTPDQLLDRVDPKVRIAVDQVPVSWLAAQFALNYPVRVDRQGATYTIMPVYQARKATTSPERRVDDYLLRIAHLDLDRTFDCTFGPQPEITQIADLTLGLMVEGQTFLQSAAIAGLGTEIEAQVGDADLEARTAPGASGSLITATPLSTGDIGYALAFGIPSGDATALSQVKGTLKIYGELAERQAAFADLTKPDQNLSLSGTDVTLTSFKSTGNGLVARVTVTRKLSDTAADQLKALPIDAAGNVDIPAPARMGRRGMRGPAVKPAPGWLLPVYVLERADGKRVYGNPAREDRTITFTGGKLTVTARIVWPSGGGIAKRVLVGVLDPGADTRDQIFLFRDVPLPGAEPAKPAKPVR
jgi:hypothetical protein